MSWILSLVVFLFDCCFLLFILGTPKGTPGFSQKLRQCVKEKLGFFS